MKGIQTIRTFSKIIALNQNNNLGITLKHLIIF